MAEHDYEHSASSTEYQEKDLALQNKSAIGTEEPFEYGTAGAQGIIPDIETDVEADGGNLEKTVTTKSAAPSVNNIKAIPNGGLVAWLQVLGAFFLFFNSWGISKCCG